MSWQILQVIGTLDPTYYIETPTHTAAHTRHALGCHWGNTHVFFLCRSGRGGFAFVYSAINLETNSLIAVKEVVRSACARSPLACISLGPSFPHYPSVQNLFLLPLSFYVMNFTGDAFFLKKKKILSSLVALCKTGWKEGVAAAPYPRMESHAFFTQPTYYSLSILAVE